MSYGREHHRGTEILEAAVVLPLLISLAFGMVEFGYFFYVNHEIQGAAREGARTAVPDGATQADVTAAVQDIMSRSGFASTDYTLTTDPSDISDAQEGDAVTVTVQCSWGQVGLAPLGLIKKDNLSAVVVMRKE